MNDKKNLQAWSLAIAALMRGPGLSMNDYTAFAKEIRELITGDTPEQREKNKNLYKA